MGDVPLIVGLRDRAPTRLMVQIKTLNGASYRLGWDDPNPLNVPQNLQFSTVMPGGFERCSFTLQRDPRLTYPDLQPLSTVVVEGPGGDIRWEGRLEKLPDVGGDQAQVTVEAFGWQAHLEDDKSTREIYIDQELSKWEGATIKRQIALVEQGYQLSGMSVGADPVTNLPAVVTSFTGGWSSSWPVSETWYDAKGIPIGVLFVSWRETNLNGADEFWNWMARFSTDGNTTADQWQLRTETSPKEHVPGAANRTWANLLLWYQNKPAGSDVTYAAYWAPAVYGRHGLTNRRSSSSEPGGFYASDVVAHAISKWAPKLKYTTGSEGTIKPTTFVIPQLAFTEPTTVAEIMKQAIRFELPDWAVWEGPTFYMHPRGEGGREWRARVGPAKLQEAGPQVSNLFNGVCVQYQDVTGVTRMVGPPGFAGGTTETESASLLDTDPENPWNELGVNDLGVKHWALLKMGTSTVAGAKRVGEIFLQESKKLETSGQAAHVGHCEDEAGVMWPVSKMRAGDTVSYVDAAHTNPRRIVKTDYDDHTKTCTVQLDQPPDQMTALLERLSVVLVGVGLS